VPFGLVPIGHHELVTADDVPEETTLGRRVRRFFPLLATGFGALIAMSVWAMGGSWLTVVLAFAIFTAGPILGFYLPTRR
jgi:hypothetical protein